MPQKSSEPERPEPIPTEFSALRELTAAAQGCTACPLYRNATQVVVGDGSEHSGIMLVGEAPGHEEDLAGKPFVGPAGRLLRQIFEELGLDPEQIYLTNAVKHFKWRAQGRRRMHVKPTYKEVMACKPWLLGEIQLIKPRVVVCLGATAAQSFLGPDFRVTQHLGNVFEMEGFLFLATLHPAAILRMPTPEDRTQARQQLFSDLSQALALTKGEKTSPIGGHLPMPPH